MKNLKLGEMGFRARDHHGSIPRGQLRYWLYFQLRHKWGRPHLPSFPSMEMLLYGFGRGYMHKNTTTKSHRTKTPKTPPPNPIELRSQKNKGQDKSFEMVKMLPFDQR